MSNFDAILDEQRAYFRDGHTKSLDFRIKQLETLKTLLKENEEELMNAVYEDFKKTTF